MGSGRSKLGKNQRSVSSGESGGGGGGRKTESMKRSESIKNEIIENAMNSRLKGVARDAKEGKGNYSFKNSKTVDKKDVNKIQDARDITRGENVVIYGTKNNKNVYYAGKKSDPEIKSYFKKKEQRSKEVAERERKAGSERPEIRTTTTYDRWRKQNERKFAAWFGKR
jgi:hypothetical protein